MSRKRTGQKAPRGKKPGGPRSWRAGLMVAGAVVGGAGVLWLASSPRVTERSARRPAASVATPNVLLITLDTTRADRLGCYGHEAAQTPTIDALAGSGIRFEEAFCQVALTLPSHTSLLAGLYPLSTGVQINGSAVLGPKVPTLAETFKSHGYRTGAFIGSLVLNTAFGLSRGFDVYDDNIRGAEYADGVHAQRRADRVCDAALKWLRAQPDVAFFAWVHLFDPHVPYDPPPGFADRLADPYDGEIAFADSQIRRLVTWLDAADVLDRTLIVLVGDHGEGLNEHGEEEHGFFVYDTTMRVPLIVSFPARFPTPWVIDKPVQVVDLFPTIVDVLGWEPPPALDGRSLASACRTGEVPSRLVYGEAEYPRISFGWARLRFLLNDGWKYIDAPKPELYDRRTDPGELNNLIDEHPSIAAQLRADLLDMTSRMKMNKRASSSVPHDDEVLGRLAGLGYVSGTATPEDPDDEPGRHDPKDMVAVFQGFTRALDLATADPSAAVRTLEGLIRQSPESDAMYDVLGAAYMRLQRFDEAERAFEASLRATPHSPRRLSSLAEALHGQNKLEEAIACYQRALAVAPDWGPAHRGLGAALSQLGQFPRAEIHWRSCTARFPESAYCLANLGSVLFAQRRPAEAVPVLQQALRHDPTSEFAYQALWQALLATGRRAEAIESLKAAEAMLPRALSVTCPLAWLVATTPQSEPGDIEDAIRWAQSCCAAAPTDPWNFDALAAAYAARGDFAQAVEVARQAIALAAARGQTKLQHQIEARLQLYEASRPFIESVRPLP